jgi:hypothetical protein
MGCNHLYSAEERKDYDALFPEGDAGCSESLRRYQLVRFSRPDSSGIPHFVSLTSVAL